MFESDLRPESNSEGHFCRLCFNKSDDLCPLFPPASIPNKALLHKIFDCTTITLSFRDDHNAQICSSCIVSIEAFFKYKIKCVENDKLLRKRRSSFFSGSGLTTTDAHQQQQLPGEFVSVPAAGRKQEGKEENSAPVKADGDDRSAPEKKDEKPPTNGGAAADCKVKQEVVEEGEDDDDDGYFNPDQFLAQETQIGDKQIDQASLNGSAQGGAGAGGDYDPPAAVPFGRPPVGWKTTEFSPQQTTAGLKPLKITDYSNLTGKRGRPQKFITTVPTERLLARSSTSNSNNPFHTSPTAVHLRGFESAYRHHLVISNGGGGKAPLQHHPSHPSSGSPVIGGNRFDPYMMHSTDQTRKVQKFLDDGLRDLIINAGTPNPNYALDGGYTNFKVVKARCNSYNLIFEKNRFLRRNKSCSGLPKWYWACSVNGCPVKICSYKGRLYKTNDKINHIHPPTEPDDKAHVTVLPEQAEADELLSSSLMQHQEMMHEQRRLQQRQYLLQHQQQQQQLQQQPPRALSQLHTIKISNAHSLAPPKPPPPPTPKVIIEEADTYEIRKPKPDENGKEQVATDILIYKGHHHSLEAKNEDGSKSWKCCGVDSSNGQTAGEVCAEKITLLADGRLELHGVMAPSSSASSATKHDDEASNEAGGDKDDHQRDGDEDGDEILGGNNDDERDAAAGGEEATRRRNRPSRVAVYDGFHYKYCHARPEGTLYWRCMLKQDEAINCPASLHTKASFEFLNINDQAHNHDRPDAGSQPEHAIVCVVTTPPPKPPAPPAGSSTPGAGTGGSTDFQLVKSGQKREFLIYQGYRYYFQYESKNGKRSYRCTMFRSCPAGAFLMPDNTIAEAKNFVHTHPPTENLEKYVTKDSLITSPIKNVDGQPARQQQRADESGHFPMLAAGSGSSGAGSEPVPSASSNEEVARANGYRIIKNYKNKEILIYNGWRYFVDYKKKNGGQVWRCSSHRLCRGAVHLFPDGSINFVKLVDHNHMPPKRNFTSSAMALTATGQPEGSLWTDNPYAGAAGGSLLAQQTDIPNAYAPPYHRYIIHAGHRFRFATRKREGTIYWRCAMRLETKCPVSFHTREDTYELVSMRNHEHNHEIPTVWPEIAGGPMDESTMPTVRMPREEIGTMDYILTKNSKGRDVILYQNGRYYLDYSRKDGKIVFRCSAVAGCRATVFLLPNKTLQVSPDMAHNHGGVGMLGAPPPTRMNLNDGGSSISNSSNNRSQLGMLPEQLQHNRPPGTSSSSTALDNGESASRVQIKTELVDGDVQIITPADPLSIDAGGAPQQQQQLSLPKFIVHHGYHYKFLSKHVENRTAFWRCSNFETKMNCGACIYTTLAGEVIRSNNVMHNHKAEDYQVEIDANNSLARRKNLIGTRDYKIVKNWKMRDVLVFQNCRYFLHYVRKDGRKVWRCSAIRSCHAAVYLGADGRVDQVKGEHVHDIRPEGEPRRRRPRRLRVDGQEEDDDAAGVGEDDDQLAVPLENGGRGPLPPIASAAPMMLAGAGHPANGGGAVGPGSVVGGGAGGGGNEWIDYSDYGQFHQQMVSGDNNSSSLWESFCNSSAASGQHPAGDIGSVIGGGVGVGFDFSYHSVFGNQPTSFVDSFGPLPTAGDTIVGDDDDDDDVGLPLEPDISFHETPPTHLFQHHNNGGGATTTHSSVITNNQSSSSSSSGSSSGSCSNTNTSNMVGGLGPPDLHHQTPPTVAAVHSMGSDL